MVKRHAAATAAAAAAAACPHVPQLHHVVVAPCRGRSEEQQLVREKHSWLLGPSQAVEPTMFKTRY
jgi:hypothetical protein